MACLIVCVNGKPRSGKDTAISALCRHLDNLGFHTGHFSSIDPVKTMLITAGIDISAKTEEDRLLLAEVGDSIQRHGQWRTRWCIERAKALYSEAADRRQPAVMFLHIREPENIRAVKEAASQMSSTKAVAIYVDGARGINADNTADQAASKFDPTLYDFTIENNDTEEKFCNEVCLTMAERLVVECERHDR